MILGAKTRITAEEYYVLPEYVENDFIQLIDGEVVIGVAAWTKHQKVVVKLILLIGQTLSKQGGELYTAPTEIYLDEENIYEPDVFYLAADTKCIVEEKRIIGAPELVVEVLSPSSLKHDREVKFRAYEKHGVQEYWIADVLSDTVSLEAWILRDGRFDLLGVFVPGESFESTVLKSFSMSVGEVFAG